MKEIILRTRKEDVVKETKEALESLGIEVRVDITFRGWIRDPSFIGFDGREYIGYTPLHDYIEQLQQGIEYPQVDDPIGTHLRAVKDNGGPYLLPNDSTAFGNYFDDEE